MEPSRFAWKRGDGTAPPAARIGPHDAVIDVPPGCSLRLDALGRWLSARIDGVPYRRTVEATVVQTSDAGEDPVDVAPDAIHDRVARLAAELAARFADPDEALQLSGETPSRELLLERLGRATTWTASAFHAQHEAFVQTYGEEIEILPPDRYMDVVVLPATGCPNAECPFCAFYLGKKLKVMSRPDWLQHLDRVEALLGPGLESKNGVFLGSASALSLSQKRVAEVLQDVAARFGPRKRGVAAFWDPDHTPRRTPADWTHLADLGLRAAYIGLETGWSELRAALHKSGDMAALHDTLAPLLASPVKLGVIVMVGVEDPEQADRHVEETVAFVASLHLRKTDVVFVSPYDAAAISPEALAAEERRLTQALRANTPAKVAPYSMARFRYYA